MRSLNSTTSEFLERLSTDDEAAWREIDRRFRPVLLGFGLRLGLPATDAADAAQDTMLEVLRGYREDRFDRRRGRLRAWIIGIARKRILTLQRLRARRHEVLHGSVDVHVPDDAEVMQIWESECRRVLLWLAIGNLSRVSRLKPQTIRAFKLFAIEGLPAVAVARRLGMTVQAVYMAKHHCISLLRQHVAELAKAYDLDSVN